MIMKITSYIFNFPWILVYLFVMSMDICENISSRCTNETFSTVYTCRFALLSNWLWMGNGFLKTYSPKFKHVDREYTFLHSLESLLFVFWNARLLSRQTHLSPLQAPLCKWKKSNIICILEIFVFKQAMMCWSLM